MKMMEQKKKKLSGSIKECFDLYKHALIAHVVSAALFYYLEIEILAVFYTLGILLYLMGCILIRNDKRIRRWILILSGEFSLTSFLGTIILGWSYGFVFYSLMLIPITFYFVYKSEEGRKLVPLAMGISVGEIVLILASLALQRSMNTLDVPQLYVEIIFLVNLMLCASTLIVYTHSFISEVYAKTFSLAHKNDELDNRINYDALTKLYSRDYFFEKAQERILSNPEVDYYMVCTDIKDFKLINDLYGNEIADNLLVKEADLIRHYFQKDAVYGRIGSDKFAMCVPKETVWEADFFRLTDKLKGMFRKSSYQLQMYAGVYEMKDIKENIAVACDKANIAIESIKGDYQRTVAYYNRDFMQSEMQRKQVLSEFEVALRKQQFCIFLQPQTSKDGMANGAEALVRWYHPTKGLVMPGDFIDYLEQAGLIYKLDAYVWEQAAYRLAQWKKQGREDLHISVNISTKDFFYMDIHKTITDLVKKYEIAPENLRLEITETALATNFNEILEVINRLQDEGFIIEIDDFGSGYSSFNMLKDFRADVLKIDREFLNETENKKRSKTILEGIIALSVKMQMDVITEGVETREQVDMLTDMGCGTFQGYYFSKPITVQEFEKKYVEA